MKEKNKIRIKNSNNDNKKKVKKKIFCEYINLKNIKNNYKLIYSLSLNKRVYVSHFNVGGGIRVIF